jgi:hypothetical protein
MEHIFNLAVIIAIFGLFCYPFLTDNEKGARIATIVLCSLTVMYFGGHLAWWVYQGMPGLN